MPIRIWTFLLSFALLSASSGSSISKQLNDFKVFKSVLLSKEGTIDLHISKSTLEKALSYAEKNLGQQHSILEQYKIYALTLSVIQCGHTQIHPNREVFREWLKARNALPIDYYLIGKKLIVNKTLNEDELEFKKEYPDRKSRKTVPAGAEILKLDHLTIPQMMDEMGLFMSSDENGVDFKYFQAKQLFEFYRNLALPFHKDSVHLQYAFKGDTNELYLLTGRAPVYTINARLQKSSVEFDKHSQNMGEFKIAQGTGFFRFYSFKVSSGKKYEAFLKQSFEQLKKRKVKRLIVDLRGNTGGAMQYSLMRYFVGEGVYLGRYVIEKPKQGVENIHLKKIQADYLRHKRGTRIQKRQIRRGKFDNGRVMTTAVDSSLVYKGTIVVITDEGTFSSAGILACHLKSLCRAKIVGRAAGGSFYSGNAGTLALELPNSQLTVYVNPNTFYGHLTPPSDPFLIKQPDVELNRIIIDPKKQDDYYFKAAKNAFK